MPDLNDPNTLVSSTTIISFIFGMLASSFIGLTGITILILLGFLFKFKGTILAMLKGVDIGSDKNDSWYDWCRKIIEFVDPTGIIVM